MGHRDVKGVSPRYATLLELSDTLLCCGLDPVRSKVNDVRMIKAGNITVQVLSAYSVVVLVEGRKPFKTRSVTEAKQFIMKIVI